MEVCSDEFGAAEEDKGGGDQRQSLIPVPVGWDGAPGGCPVAAEGVGVQALRGHRVGEDQPEPEESPTVQRVVAVRAGQVALPNGLQG